MRLPATLPPSLHAKEEADQLRRLEFASICEATTLVALVGIAVPLKHFAGWQLGVRCLGPIHGIAFLFYCWTVVQTVANGGWRGTEVVRLIVVALVPIAGFFNIAWIERKRNAILSTGPSSA